MEGAEEALALASSFGPVAPLSGPAAAELRMRDALTGLARYSMILGATDTTFRVHGLVQTVGSYPYRPLEWTGGAMSGL
jgi:hypothetical protein